MGHEHLLGHPRNGARGAGFPARPADERAVKGRHQLGNLKPVPALVAAGVPPVPKFRSTVTS